MAWPATPPFTPKSQRPLGPKSPRLLHHQPGLPYFPHGVRSNLNTVTLYTKGKAKDQPILFPIFSGSSNLPSPLHPALVPTRKRVVRAWVVVSLPICLRRGPLPRSPACLHLRVSFCLYMDPPFRQVSFLAQQASLLPEVHYQLVPHTHTGDTANLVNLLEGLCVGTDGRAHQRPEALSLPGITWSFPHSGTSFMSPPVFSCWGINF